MDVRWVFSSSSKVLALRSVGDSWVPRFDEEKPQIRCGSWTFMSSASLKQPGSFKKKYESQENLSAGKSSVPLGHEANTFFSLK